MSWSTSELRVRLVPFNMFKPSSNFFADHSKAVLLLWILFEIHVSCLSLLCGLVCSLQPCDHLLGEGWPLGSLVCFVMVWPCPGSCVILDCIASWSLSYSPLSKEPLFQMFTWRNKKLIGNSISRAIKIALSVSSQFVIFIWLYSCDETLHKFESLHTS